MCSVGCRGGWLGERWEMTYLDSGQPICPGNHRVTMDTSGPVKTNCWIKHKITARPGQARPDKNLQWNIFITGFYISVINYYTLLLDVGKKNIISAVAKKKQRNIGREAEDVKYKARWSQLFHPHSWSIFYNTKHQVNCAIYLEHQQFCLARIVDGTFYFFTPLLSTRTVLSSPIPFEYRRYDIVDNMLWLSNIH